MKHGAVVYSVHRFGRVRGASFDCALFGVFGSARGCVFGDARCLESEAFAEVPVVESDVPMAVHAALDSLVME